MRLTIALALVLAASGGLLASTRRGPSATAVAPATERLRYQATWNGVAVARAELLIAPTREKTVELRGRAETNEALDLLWRMRDSFEATVATAPPGPDRFLLHQHENEHRRETTVTRDPDHGRLLGSKRKRGHTPKTASAPLAPRLHDPASLAYLVRTLPAELASPQTYEVFTGTKSYRVTVAPAGDETLEAIGRRWPARKLRLALQLVATDEKPSGAEGAVQNAELWVSSGPERLPLKLQAETFWGWVTVELVGRGAAGTPA
jgi:hypothetical protein